MVRLDLANHYVGYFDTVHQDPSDKYLNESCDMALALLDLGFTHKGLDFSSKKFTYHREKVRKHCFRLGWNILTDGRV